MRLSLEPLSAVPGRLLREHLLRYGLRPEIIHWKYFDPAFGCGRERGYVWLREGKVMGMIGLIPYAVAGPGEAARECGWTCDWFVEASAKHPGIGVLILKGAIERAGLLTTFGGNDATARLVPRLATTTIPEAGVELSLPLRVGGTRTFGGIEARVSLGRLGRLGRLRLRRMPAARSDDRVRSAPGVARVLSEVTDRVQDHLWAPRYDHQYVEWQVGRCPTLESATVYDADTPPRAVAVVWTEATTRRRWRMAVWREDGAEDRARAVLAEAIRQVVRRGGEVLSVIAARGDAALLEVLRTVGLRSVERSLPLYVLSAIPADTLPGLGRLSYLDSDLAHRF